MFRFPEFLRQKTCRRCFAFQNSSAGKLQKIEVAKQKVKQGRFLSRRRPSPMERPAGSLGSAFEAAWAAINTAAHASSESEAALVSDVYDIENALSRYRVSDGVRCGDDTVVGYMMITHPRSNGPAQPLLSVPGTVPVVQHALNTLGVSRVRVDSVLHVTAPPEQESQFHSQLVGIHSVRPPRQTWGLFWRHSDSNRVQDFDVPRSVSLSPSFDPLQIPRPCTAVGYLVIVDIAEEGAHIFVSERDFARVLPVCLVQYVGTEPSEFTCADVS